MIRRGVAGRHTTSAVRPSFARAMPVMSSVPTPASPPRTLPLAREAFVAAIRRDTPGTDLPRFVAVLDDLLAWSTARPGQLAFRGGAGPADVLRFARAGATAAFWTVRAARGGAPTLEIAVPAGYAGAVENRARATATLNAHARTVLAGDDRLRIGFGALKNEAARTAVLALLDELLAAARPTETAAPA
ncbi:hypothetical protein tb265_25000 [Gemmatimonadetes bacterium T265]|nr:hypothetical protein tb265_25000 [Gemmatimonadetes bacterium T265]